MHTPFHHRSAAFNLTLIPSTLLPSDPIPATGRRITYRGYLIHAERPGITYAIYGRNAHDRLIELGSASSFSDAMIWVDRHLQNLSGLDTNRLKAPAPANDRPTPTTAKHNRHSEPPTPDTDHFTTADTAITPWRIAA